MNNFCKLLARSTRKFLSLEYLSSSILSQSLQIYETIAVFKVCYAGLQFSFVFLLLHASAVENGIFRNQISVSDLEPEPGNAVGSNESSRDPIAKSCIQIRFQNRICINRVLVFI